MGNKTKLAFKSDTFKKNRGGYSRWLLLSCEKCKNNLSVYQKDGIGILKRLYLDRIISPRSLTAKENLVCKKCKAMLGVPIIYRKESRPAFRLFAGAVEKKILRGENIKGGDEKRTRATNGSGS